MDLLQVIPQVATCNIYGKAELLLDLFSLMSVNASFADWAKIIIDGCVLYNIRYITGCSFR